ncbi:MAG TPA: DUF952 domain-containing protein, partial [Rhizomicrobium sp.]
LRMKVSGNEDGMLIFKIVPRVEWESAGDFYAGSAHDQADGFLHFSTGPQLAETLRLYYAGQNDLVLAAVDPAKVAADLKWERSPSRGEDFPHLFSTLPRAAVTWAKPLVRGADGTFTLPDLT